MALNDCMFNVFFFSPQNIISLCGMNAVYCVVLFVKNRRCEREREPTDRRTQSPDRCTAEIDTFIYICNNQSRRFPFSHFMQSYNHIAPAAGPLRKFFNSHVNSSSKKKKLNHFHNDGLRNQTCVAIKGA